MSWDQAFIKAMNLRFPSVMGPSIYNGHEFIMLSKFPSVMGPSIYNDHAFKVS